jgi:hypothetical protein
MNTGNAKLVVHSVGRAGIGLVRSLRQVMLVPEPDIASLLLQAPSILMTSMASETAHGVAAILRESGLDCGVIDGEDACVEGCSEFDVALQINDFSRMSAVILEVMQLLGVDVATARHLVCAVPAPLLGGVSAATVTALHQRFAPLGGEVIASRIEGAAFDLFLGPIPAALHERIRSRLQSLLGDVTLDFSDGAVLAGLTQQQTSLVLPELRSLSLAVRVVNRDFARYAVSLQQAQNSPALRDCLARWTGMPAAVVPRVLSHLPVAIHQALDQKGTECLLSELAALSAYAVAEPVALQRFGLVLDGVRESLAIVSILRDIGELDETLIQTTLRQHKPCFPGPFAATQARWLLQELRQIWVAARLEAL